MNRKQYLLLAVLTIVSALIGSVVFNWIFMGGTVRASDASEEKILAQRFELVDKEGKMRGFFGMDDGKPGLWLYDNDGNCRIVLSVLPDGSPGLVLGGNEKTRVALFVMNGWQPVLTFHYSNGKPCTTLGIPSDKGPSLTLHDSDGNKRFGLNVSPDGASTLVLADSYEKPRAVLHTLPGGSPGLTFHDVDGYPRALLGIMLGRTPALMLSGKDQQPRAIFSMDDNDIPILALQNKDGKTIWSAPSALQEQTSSLSSTKGFSGTATTYDWDSFYLLEGTIIVADDGQPLGVITTNSLDPDSLINELGKYGNELRSNSIFNELGKYGSELSSLSPFNELSSKPPKIYDRDGEFIAYFTVNKFKFPRVDPILLIAWLKANK